MIVRYEQQINHCNMPTGSARTDRFTYKTKHGNCDGRLIAKESNRAADGNRRRRVRGGTQVSVVTGQSSV
jgi:hypothetical protein